MKKLLLSLVITVLFCQVGGASIITNGDFEAPISSGYDKPTTGGWVYAGSGASGEVGLLSDSAADAWYAAVGNYPYGQCIAMYGTGNVSQTVSLAAGTYTFSLDAAKNSGVSSSVMTVMLGGTALTFSGGALTLTDNAMASFVSDPITVAAGDYTLQFQSDTWSFLDNASATVVPEPATMSLLALGGVVGLIRRKR